MGLSLGSSKTKKHSLVFFGNERIATGVSTTVPTLKALIKAGYDIKAVVSNYERGTSRNSRELEIKAVAEAHNIPLLLPEKPSDIADELHSFNAEAAVLVAYGRIVPQAIIDIFPKGIINIHPSLLPLHRGPTPIESVILQGEEITGVSVMQLAKAMDAGPVFGQVELQLKGNETKQELADTLLAAGGKLLIKLLPKILKGKLTPTTQDETKATYDKLIAKEDGRINWDKTAHELAREIRAYAEWPKSYTTIAGKDVIVIDAGVAAYEIHGADITNGHAFAMRSATEENGYIGVATGEGVLLIERLKPAGKNEMTAKEFIAGYGRSLND